MSQFKEDTVSLESSIRKSEFSAFAHPLTRSIEHVCHGHDQVQAQVHIHAFFHISKCYAANIVVINIVIVIVVAMGLFVCSYVVQIHAIKSERRL